MLHYHIYMLFQNVITIILCICLYIIFLGSKSSSLRTAILEELRSELSILFYKIESTKWLGISERIASAIPEAAVLSYPYIQQVRTCTFFFLYFDFFFFDFMCLYYIFLRRVCMFKSIFYFKILLILTFVFYFY